jgi:hypothetical protein
MPKKLVPLSVGVAMLGSVGLAHAETKAPVVASTKTQMETPKVVRPQAVQRMALTDEQMGQITAGHARGDVPKSLEWHWGFYEIEISGVWKTFDYVWHRG